MSVIQLGPNERAVVVPLGSPQSVGGQIAAGSHVDFWVTTSGQGASGVTRPIAKLLFQNMYVLGVNGGNVTLQARRRGRRDRSSTPPRTPRSGSRSAPTVGTNLTRPPVIGSVTGG